MAGLFPALGEKKTMAELGQRIWERPVIGLYRAYRKKLSWLGGYRKKPIETSKAEGDRYGVEYDDANATNIGDLFRGYGLLAAMAFVGILCTELFHARTAFWIRLALMGLLFGVVIYVNYLSKLREKWSAHRSEAEKNRYAALDRKLNEHSGDEDLAQQCNFHLADQIHYNDDCRRQYHALERLSTRIVWVGFSVLLVHTALELIHVDIAPPWWLRCLWTFLRFSSALAIGLLVFNAFINLWRLKDHHQETAEELRRMQGELTSGNSGKSAEKMSRDIRDYLESRDKKWAQHVGGMFIMPGG